MKSILTALIICLTSTTIFAQLQVDSFYNNKNEFLIYSVIEEFDSLTQEVLNVKIKNWAGTNFANMKEVLVSETKEQLVFNYITNSFFYNVMGTTTTLTWYIRMVVQTKDNKIRILFYDDGNAFWPGSYSGGVAVPSIAARTYKFTNYFKEEGVCRKRFSPGIENVRNSVLKTSENIIKNIKSNNAENPNSEW
jgi:hypothetical protein